MAFRCSFFVIGYKGFHFLKWFCEQYSADRVKMVIAARDPHVKEDCFDAIKEFCKQKGISFGDRKDILTGPGKEWTFVIGWKWMLPVQGNILIFHDSLLPKYRGFAPLVNALINGDREIGVTAINAAEGYDEGPILDQERFMIDYPLKIREAIHLVAEKYCLLAQRILESLLQNKPLVPVEQNHAAATYSLWRDEADYRIDWTLDSNRIKREIDALGYPYRGAYCFLGEQKIVLEDAEVADDVVIENRDAGKVIFQQDGFPVVVCGKGLLKIKAAYEVETGNNILPLYKFRSRFH